MSAWTDITGVIMIDRVPEHYLSKLYKNIFKALGKPVDIYSKTEEKTICPYGVNWHITKQEIPNHPRMKENRKYNVFINIHGNLEGFTDTRTLESWIIQATKELETERYTIEINCPYYECPEEDRYIKL